MFCEVDIDSTAFCETVVMNCDVTDVCARVYFQDVAFWICVSGSDVAGLDV